MFQSKKAFSCVSLVRLTNVEELHGHVHTQGNYKPKTGLTSRGGIKVAPLEVSDGPLVVIEAHYRIRLLGRPDENTGIIQSRAC